MWYAATPLWDCPSLSESGAFSRRFRTLCSPPRWLWEAECVSCHLEGAVTKGRLSGGLLFVCFDCVLDTKQVTPGVKLTIPSSH